MKESSPKILDLTDPLAIENAIFETALELGDPRLRMAYLARSYQGDPEGLARMEGLLAIAGESAAFFLESQRERAAIAGDILKEMPEDLPGGGPSDSRDSEGPGTVIGRYQILRKIGEGGCGVVYESGQDGMRRTVALKVIRLGMDTDAVVERFGKERHLLELMEHPNIARMLDAGETPGGRPYFVMELVPGRRIDVYCRETAPAVREKILVFLQICQAIQHAHQKGVIHRDIKPSNILVEIQDGVPTPKVIDFGIAKATEEPRWGRRGSARAGQLVGTPSYMSPEQVDMGGMDIDTRSDIYSLGALLYELLCGRPPFDPKRLDRAGLSEMRRIVMNENPPLPSEIVLAPGNDAGGTPRTRRKLAATLRGDLDSIVGKALQKDRNRRYDTVNSLAMDLRRYLAREPVIARTHNRLYLARKFFLRNRVACLSGIVGALSLAGGMGTATNLYIRERKALQEQERLKWQAETAETQEKKLRRRAQARANVSRVAILLSQGKTAEADLLLTQNPLENIEPSLEATEAFRALGGWNAVYGRWEQSKACFELMSQANRFGDQTYVVEGFDLLMMAPAYLEAGDRPGYLAFRDDVLQRLVPARSSLQAEHLLKVCLLLPADENVLKRLEETAAVCRSGMPAVLGAATFPEWNALSLGLYHYRRGDFGTAVEDLHQCLSVSDANGTRQAAARCVLAMALDRQDDRKNALVELKCARKLIEAQGSRFDGTDNPASGRWFAWAVARILLREAVAQIEKS